MESCGDRPILGTGLGAAVATLGSGEPGVELVWNPATDESRGERDVVRYVIWRRSAGDPEWGDPYVSIPAGSPSYLYTDAAVAPGETYLYALAAQDCTPSLSDRTTAGPVTIP